MATICFLDTECNSLDTQRGFIQELAWAIYDVDTRRLLKSTSHLLRWNMPYTMEPEAQAVTGLSREFCENNGKFVNDVFCDFLTEVETCDAICGHNLIDYDFQMLCSNIKRAMFTEPPPDFLAKFAFDTYFDLPIKNPRQIMTLKYLALDHGYVLSDAHQALADVFACAYVFFSYPFEESVLRARTPLITMHGHTDYKDTPGREAFYRQKFRWNRDNRRWERRCRAFYVSQAQLELGRDLFCGDKIIKVEKPDDETQLKLL